MSITRKMFACVWRGHASSAWAWHGLTRRDFHALCFIYHQVFTHVRAGGLSCSSTFTEGEKTSCSVCPRCAYILHSLVHLAHLPSANSAKRKRTDANIDDDNANSDLTELESSDAGEDDDMQDYGDPKPKAKSAARRKAKGSGPVKKSRSNKLKDSATTSTPQPKKSRARKTKEIAVNGQNDSGKVPQEAKIAGDNGLFSTLRISHDLQFHKPSI